MTHSSTNSLSIPRLFSFSTVALPLGAVIIAVAIYLPAHLAGRLGLGMTAIGVSWATVRIIDLFVDPVLGLIMDRTRTRFGRYRPWIVVGAPILMAALWALFEARPGISSGYLIAWLLALYLGQSILTMGHSAWAANVAADYDDRSRAFGAIGIATVLGGLLVIVAPMAAPLLGLPSKEGVHSMGWFMVALTPCVVALAVTTVSEPTRIGANGGVRWADLKALIVKPDLIRLLLAQLCLTLGPGWMAGLFLFFLTASRGLTSQQASLLLLLNIGAGLFGAWGVSRLALRIGKHRALIAASLAFLLGLLLFPFMPKGSVLAVAPLMLWLGFMTAGYSVMTNAMLADVGDEVRLERGRDQLTLIYALNAVSNKIAWALSIGLAFPLLSMVGFNPAEGASNTPQAIKGLEIAFLGGPIVFVTLAAFCMVGWRLNAERHADIRRQLLALDAGASSMAQAETLVFAALEPSV